MLRRKASKKLLTAAIAAVIAWFQRLLSVSVN
jgi:hypothetical protein